MNLIHIRIAYFSIILKSMDIINSIILGIVEGITEFLPISSTAHLIFASKFLRISQSEFQKFFEVFIQSGAILAVVLLYLKYLVKNKHVISKLIISFLPTSLIGFLLYKFIKGVFFTRFSLIVFAFIFIGAVFLLVEILVHKKKFSLVRSIKDLSIVEALIIGLGQSLAVVPGVSRAGIVIVIMMLMRSRREEAALYSFLLAIPTILAASIYDLYKMKSIIFTSETNLLIVAVGFIVSFATAYFSVKWFISYLQKNSLVLFGFYRIIAGFLLLIFGF